MDVLITLFGVLVVLAVVGGLFFLYFALKKALSVNEELTVALSTSDVNNTELLKSNDTLVLWFDEFKTRIISAYQRIKAIDAGGHFEADDEVGYFFKELKSIIERLNELGMIDEIEKQDATETTKSKITTEEIKNIIKERERIQRSAREEK